jgi:hypothetical protein
VCSSSTGLLSIRRKLFWGDAVHPLVRGKGREMNAFGKRVAFAIVLCCALVACSRGDSGRPERTASQSARLSDGDGLSASYYKNMFLAGTPLTRVDPVIDFDWTGGSPDPSIGVDYFSARWTLAQEPQKGPQRLQNWARGVSSAAPLSGPLSQCVWTTAAATTAVQLATLNGRYGPAEVDLFPYVPIPARTAQASVVLAYTRPKLFAPRFRIPTGR